MIRVSAETLLSKAVISSAGFPKRVGTDCFRFSPLGDNHLLNRLFTPSWAPRRQGEERV